MRYLSRRCGIFLLLLICLLGKGAVVQAAESTMTQQYGIITWSSSGSGSNNYKNTWRWRVVGWNFSFYRNGVRNLDYYYDTLSRTEGTVNTQYSLILDEVVAETGADLRTGDMRCIANARIEFRHFNGQSVVDKNFYVGTEAEANYWWDYYGMSRGTGQYGQNCKWQSFYLDVKGGEGIASTTGSGWYNYGATVPYTGTCAPGYFEPTSGNAYIDGNKQVVVTAKKRYYIAYNGNGATGGSMANQEATYGERTALNRNQYTRQYNVVYDAAGGSTAVPSQKANAAFRRWLDSGTGKTYSDGAEISNLTDRAGATVNFTAEWINPTITLPAAERSGYGLLGWSKTKGAGTPEYLPGAKVAIDKNTEFYAVWKRLNFNVSYIGNEQDGGNDFTEYCLEQKDDYTLFSNLDEGEKHFTKDAVVSFTDSLSGEVIEEYTTKTVTGWSFVKDNKRDTVYELDMIVSGAGLYEAAEAAGNITIRAPAAAYNTYPDGADGEEIGKPSDAAEEYINLYAVWDCGAVIEAYDLFYTLEEAQSGKITELELLSHAKAWDEECMTPNNRDGILSCGEDALAGTTFVVEDYDESELQSFTGEGSVTETYFAEDAAGNMTRRRITVYIIDSSTGFVDAGDGNQIRFISQQYLDTLGENSVWRVDRTYHDALENALTGTEEYVAEWMLSHEDVQNIKNHISKSP